MNAGARDAGPVTTDTYTLYRGTTGLLVSVPHDGTRLPDDIASRLTESARRVPDTDWHVARLYDFAREAGASMIVPRFSRYVVDLNRSEDDVSLYPGQNTTGLCPIVQFDGQPVYCSGLEPVPEEIAQRIDRYWRPYHAALRSELDRLHAGHGRVVLWEGHTIRSELPYLFEDRLPDLNLGTASGNSCSPGLQLRLENVLARHGRYSYIVNGRFKGGHITRHYGDPANGIEAVQLEISQRIYMDETSFHFDAHKASQASDIVKRLVDVSLAF